MREESVGYTLTEPEQNRVLKSIYDRMKRGCPVDLVPHSGRFAL